MGFAAFASVASRQLVIANALGYRKYSWDLYASCGWDGGNLTVSARSSWGLYRSHGLEKFSSRIAQSALQSYLCHVSSRQTVTCCVISWSYEHRGHVERSCNQLTRHKKSKEAWLQGTATAFSEMQSRQMTQGLALESGSFLVALTSSIVFFSTFCRMSSSTSMQ